jgi:cytochrome P450
VYVDNAALQTDKSKWGANALKWRPNRWIRSNGEDETFMPPVENALLSWGAGPRVCPGRKFSQVEFVGVVACLVHQHRAVVVPAKGENEKMARERIMGVLSDSDHTLAMGMNHPERLKVRWEACA